MAEWEDALASENQRQAKLIVMEAIHAAERRGIQKGRQEIREQLVRLGFVDALVSVDQLEAEGHVFKRE